MKSLCRVFTIFVILLLSRLVSAEVSLEAKVSHPPAVNPGLKTSPSEIPELGTRETLDYEHFGTVAIYRKTEHPPLVAIFVSGDGGWEKEVIVMSKELKEMNTLVVGINIKNYFPYLRTAHGRCTFPAADLGALGEYVQKTLGYPQYVPPILIGYSSGATLVYAALAQAPPNTFVGAISFGFCPDLQLRKPFCRG